MVIPNRDGVEEQLTLVPLMRLCVDESAGKGRLPKCWSMGTHTNAGFMPNRHETVTNRTLVESYLIRSIGHDIAVVLLCFTMVCMIAAGEISSCRLL